MDSGKKIIAIIVAAAMCFAGGFAGGYFASDIKEAINGTGTSSSQQEENKGNTSGQTSSIVINVTEDYTLAEAIAEKAMPSVVSVTTTYEVAYSGWGWGGGGYTRESSCVGTGFIVSENGYIVTNSHVVNDGDYKTVLISLYGGEEIEGTVLWNDSTLDLAIVKIECTGLVAAELGDSDKVKLGSYAAAIGNPLGLTFERSITQGIISGLDRTITVSSDSSLSGTTMEGLFQTDAAINSGNSGGPLYNAKGEVIGINSAKASDGESMGFAIPINTVKPIIEQILLTGKFERVYLGITAIGIEQQSSVSEEALINYYGSAKGIYIASVSERGGAQKAGLKAGDVILSVNGTSVGTMNKLYALLVAYKSGDTVELVYLRDGKQHTTEVILKTADEIE